MATNFFSMNFLLCWMRHPAYPVPPTIYWYEIFIDIFGIFIYYSFFQKIISCRFLKVFKIIHELYEIICFYFLFPYIIPHMKIEIGFTTFQIFCEFHNLSNKNIITYLFCINPVLFLLIVRPTLEKKCPVFLQCSFSVWKIWNK